MGSTSTGEAQVTWVDRLGHWQTRHPWVTGAVFAVVLLLGLLSVVALRGGISVLTVGTAVPISAVCGSVMVRVQRSGLIVRHRLDLAQYSALRRGYRSARRGEPVDLDPPLHELALSEARRQLRVLRPARWALFGIGTIQLLIGATLLWLDLQFDATEGGGWTWPLGFVTGLLMIGLAVYSPRSARRIVANLERHDGPGQDGAAARAV